ncbi:MAG: response regulator transcription factor [Bryobacterales bacterium]|nr:response regulator transcription factor [Bryobacterales bacterium]
MNRPRVLVADDHRIVAEGLRGLLEPELEIVEIVEDGRALLEAHDRLHPDVVVADVSMPLLNGIEAVRQLRKAGSRAKFVFLTMHPDVSYATGALAAGASGYVLKHSAPDELLTAVREALAGRTYITPRVAGEVLEALRTGEAGEAVRLTTRQTEVLQLVAEGRSAKEIGAILNLSPRTVESHKYAIMDAIGVKTTAELVQYAVKNGLVRP